MLVSHFPLLSSQALMPAAVYACGIGFGTEKYAHNYALNMVLVTIGVAAASYGER